MNRRLRRRRGWLSAVVVLAVLAGLAGVVTTSRSGAATYRTAAVERGDVESTLDALGTIQPVNQANLSFPVAGVVRSVAAVIGQHVGVGQTLAELDTTSLNAQVAAAQSTVAAAQARLASDSSSQTDDTSTVAVAPAAFRTAIAPTATNAGSTGSSDPVSAARNLVTTQQARLVAGQHLADQDLAREQHDLSAENTACQALLASPDDSRSPSPPQRQPARATASTARTSAAVPVPPAGVASPAGGTGAPDASGCEAAARTVLADQIAVEHDQQAVAAMEPALDGAIDKLVAAVQAGNQPAPQPRAQPQPPHNSQPSSGQQRPSTTGPASKNTALPRSPAEPAARAPAPTRPASAEQLTSDQTAVDAAQAELAEAQQARDQAELRSPIDGTVGSVAINPGAAVPGDSSSPQLVVIGPGSHQVITSISDTAIGSVRLGDAATIIPSGSSTPVHGQIVSIGVLSSASSTTGPGSVSYPVTIGLTGTGQQLFAGQSASVSILMGHASGSLTVPSSAVHHAGALTTVTVLRQGIASTVRVSLGAVGPTRTQILSGLSQGDQVVLAELSQPLPTTSLQNIQRIAGGGGSGSGGGRLVR
jgi:multidrug efflux pump subunit AcrA (membrane-fusion protein)